MKTRFGIAMSLVVVPFLLAARTVGPVAHFQITLERTAMGWAVQCDTGCAWAKLSIFCANDCRVLIDATGVVPNFSGGQTDAAFGFILSRADKGYQAETVAGTAWTNIGWECLPRQCRALIDEVGVTLPQN